MSNSLHQVTGGVFFLKDGSQRDPFGLENFTPASNINRIEIYLEDGLPNNVVSINYRSMNKGYPSSVFFPLFYVETVSKLLTGDNEPRTFAKFWGLVPTQVLQWNANGSSPMPVDTTVVQMSGEGLLGVFQFASTLENAHPASEELYDENAVAYVLELEGENNYGFYMVAFDSGTSEYSWERIETPINQIEDIQSKQYNVLGMKIQKGNLPHPTSTVSISEQYIRYILAYLSQINADNEQLQDDKLSRDGSQPMLGVLDMAGYKIFDVGNPTNNKDAANKKYVDDTEINIMENVDIRIEDHNTSETAHADIRENKLDTGGGNADSNISINGTTFNHNRPTDAIEGAEFDARATTVDNRFDSVEGDIDDIYDLLDLDGDL